MQLAVFFLVAVVGVLYLATRSDDAAASVEQPQAAPAPIADSVSGLAAAFVDQVSAVVSSLWAPPPAAAPYLEQIALVEAKYGMPANLLARQLDIESAHFAPDVISGARVSSAGAKGIGQFMAPTAEQFGIDPTDPRQAIEAAGKYMRALYDQFGSWSSALAAYNWGPGNIRKLTTGQTNPKTGQPYTLPAETVAYLEKILPAIGLTTTS